MDDMKDIDTSSMDDDEFMKFLNGLDETSPNIQEDGVIETETVEDHENDVDNVDNANEEEKSEEEEDNTDNSEEEETEEEDSEESEEDVDDSTKSETESQEEPDADFYKEVYEQITSPFKANGKEIKVESVDDAIQLMRMGANYTKKMQAIAPYRKLGKTLEEEGLLENPDTINHLIDLHKGKPEAIAKLVKESKVDIYELNMDSADSYKPKSYGKSDKEYDLQETIDDVKTSEHGREVLSVIGNDWDDASREVIADNPELLKELQGHAESGVFGKIVSVIEQRNVLGKLNGMSFIEAYDSIGKELYGKSDSDDKSDKGKAEDKKPDTEDKGKKITQHKAKKAVSRSPRKKTPKSFNDVNPFELDDDEFQKMFSQLNV